VKLHFELAARSIHDRANAVVVFVLAILIKSHLLFEFLFGDTLFVDISGWRALHRGLCAGALLRRHPGESLGGDGGHSSHGMSYGHFPEAFFDIEGRDFDGGPEEQREKNDQSKKKFGSHQDSPGVVGSECAEQDYTPLVAEQIKCEGNRLQGKSLSGPGDAHRHLDAIPSAVNAGSKCCTNRGDCYTNSEHPAP